MFGKALIAIVALILVVSAFLTWVDGRRRKRRERQQKVFLDVTIENVPFWGYNLTFGPFDTIEQLRAWERRFLEGLKSLSLPCAPAFTHRYSDSRRWSPEEAVEDVRRSMLAFSSLPPSDLPKDRYVN